MEWKTVRFDWNQVRAFLVTAEEGSLSAAARALNLTQPTLSRQVAALEQDLGVTLFERAGRSLLLTETGLTLLEHVRAMGEAAARVSLSASGQSEAIEGKVSITATDMVSAYVLPEILSVLSDRAPGITVEVIADNDVRNLQRREADIALRNAAPTEPDLIARRLRDGQAVFSAAQSYLDRYGPINTLEDLQNAYWVGYTHPQEMSDVLRERLNIDVAIDRFRYTCETGIVVWEMIKAGLGVSILPGDQQKVAPGLVQILPNFPKVPVPLYLITHRELRTSRRIRVVFDLLAEMLGPNSLST